MTGIKNHVVLWRVEYSVFTVHKKHSGYISTLAFLFKKQKKKDRKKKQTSELC